MLTLLHRTKTLCCAVIVLLFVPHMATSALWPEDPVKVQNVRFEVVGTKLVVHYDLQGPLGREYVVKVSLKREQNPSFTYLPKALAGDIGEGAFAGTDRKISWDLLKEFYQGLDGDDYYFVVEAELIAKGASPLWYIGGGVAVVGGVAAYILSKSPKTESAVETGFPKPVGRPSGN
jgi:hypothetical protein